MNSAVFFGAAGRISVFKHPLHGWSIDCYPSPYEDYCYLKHGFQDHTSALAAANAHKAEKHMRQVAA